MHGLGNDFIVIDGRNFSLPDLNKKAAQLCDRRLGIGADQLLLLDKSEQADDSSYEKPITDINKKEKSETKKPIENKPKKTEAVVNGKSVPISTKHSIAICNMIRNKEIDKAILLLEQAEQKRIPVPMKGEIPHRKGIMSGRYPVNALSHFIKSLKVLKANALANELELEKYVIFCKANIASRPYRRFGRGKFKRTHVEIKLILPIKKKIRRKND